MCPFAVKEQKVSVYIKALIMASATKRCNDLMAMIEDIRSERAKVHQIPTWACTP
jgi:hypothetical protein